MYFNYLYLHPIQHKADLQNDDPFAELDSTFWWNLQQRHMTDGRGLPQTTDGVLQLYVRQKQISFQEKRNPSSARLFEIF